MEQRILQYRKSIDEWLEKTEQSAQVSQEILRDKMEEHLNQIGFFQHERLIHLIVTVTFALLEMLAILLNVISDSLFSLLLPVVILILLVPYIRHYYILENEVQKMYVQYDRMRRLQPENFFDISIKRNTRFDLSKKHTFLLTTDNRYHKMS